MDDEKKPFMERIADTVKSIVDSTSAAAMQALSHPSLKLRKRTIRSTYLKQRTQRPSHPRVFLPKRESMFNL